MMEEIGKKLKLDEIEKIPEIGLRKTLLIGYVWSKAKEGLWDNALKAIAVYPDVEIQECEIKELARVLVYREFSSSSPINKQLIKVISSVLEKTGNSLNRIPFKEKFVENVKKGFPLDKLDTMLKVVRETGIDGKEYERWLQAMITERIRKGTVSCNEYDKLFAWMMALKMSIDTKEFLKKADAFLANREMRDLSKTVELYKSLDKIGVTLGYNRKEVVKIYEKRGYNATMKRARKLGLIQ